MNKASDRLTYRQGLSTCKKSRGIPSSELPQPSLNPRNLSHPCPTDKSSHQGLLSPGVTPTSPTRQLLHTPSPAHISQFDLCLSILASHPNWSSTALWDPTEQGGCSELQDLTTEIMFLLNLLFCPPSHHSFKALSAAWF